MSNGAIDPSRSVIEQKYCDDVPQGFLAVGELDPLNRRLGAQKKPDVVVQVVILAEDNDIRDKLAEHDLHVQTIAEVAPIEVQPARVLSHLYTYLGRNKKLGLSGRKSRDVGILSTSKLYSLKDRIFAFTPQVTNCVVTLVTPVDHFSQTATIYYSIDFLIM